MSNQKPSVTFSAFGRATAAYDSSSDVLVGANLGVAELVGFVERSVSYEKRGSSRAETAVAGSASFSVQGFVPALEALEGETFSSVKDVRDAVRLALSAVR